MNDSTLQSAGEAQQGWVYSAGSWSLTEDPVMNQPGADSDLTAGIKAAGYETWTGVGKEYTMPLILTVYSRLREPCYLFDLEGAVHSEWVYAKTLPDALALLNQLAPTLQALAVTRPDRSGRAQDHVGPRGPSRHPPRAQPGHRRPHRRTLTGRNVHVSQHAISYVHSRNIADETARRVFLAVAEQSQGEGDILGLNLWDADIPVLAQRAGLDADEFRRQLRTLKQHVRMDVLEHSDGLWEIVYGPTYTQPPRPRPVTPNALRAGPQAFWMPGWDHYSTWGYDEGLACLYAQLFANQDDPDAAPRIWITPPRYQVRTVDELAAAIAEALTPHTPVPVPAEVIKSWLTTPPR